MVLDERAEKKNLRRYRLLLVVVILVVLLVVAKATGLTDLDKETIGGWVASAGWWGFVLYAVTFAGGEFMHIPGMVFVGAGILAYGGVFGFFCAFGASVISVCFSFALIRTIGGKALGDIERPLIRKMPVKLDDHPIRTVAILRLVLWLLPALNYALALTNLRFRDYLIGSAIGLILPIAGATIVFDLSFRALL